jgi:hypothetical protein
MGFSFLFFYSFYLLYLFMSLFLLRDFLLRLGLYHNYRYGIFRFSFFISSFRLSFRLFFFFLEFLDQRNEWYTFLFYFHSVQCLYMVTSYIYSI